MPTPSRRDTSSTAPPLPTRPCLRRSGSRLTGSTRPASAANHNRRRSVVLASAERNYWKPQAAVVEMGRSYLRITSARRHGLERSSKATRAAAESLAMSFAEADGPPASWSISADVEVVLVSSALVAAILLAIFVTSICYSSGRPRPSFYLRLSETEGEDIPGALALTRQPTLPRWDSKKTVSVQVPGAPGVVVWLRHELQHTVVWDEPLGELPPGECNLYTYPNVATEGDASARRGGRVGGATPRPPLAAPRAPPRTQC